MLREETLGLGSLLSAAGACSACLLFFANFGQGLVHKFGGLFLQRALDAHASCSEGGYSVTGVTTVIQNDARGP